MSEIYTREFFRQELEEFLTAIGSKSLMTSRRRSDGLAMGIAHVYLHAKDLTDGDIQDFQVAIDMFVKRQSRLMIDGRVGP